MNRELRDVTQHTHAPQTASALMAAAICCGVIALVCDHAAASYTAKINSTPDYTQTDATYGGFADGGVNYCAPVAVSNSLMWLANNGFPALSPHTADPKHDQFVVADDLGRNYMDAIDGTSASQLCNGLDQYLTDKGYTSHQIAYQGWRYTDSEYDSGIDVPDIASLKAGIEGIAGVWLNIGWYDYNAATDTYTRFNGHWITLLGYGHDGTGDNPDYLIAHDPAPRAGTTFANEYIEAIELTSGTLSGSYSGLPRSAVGFYELAGGIHVRSDADAALLDGVVILTMVPEPGTSIILITGAIALMCRSRQSHL